MNKHVEKHLNARKDFRDAEGWVKIVGRIGLVALGFVYVVLGILAIRYAIGAGGQLADARGALREIAQQPFGQTLLVLTGLGLIAYAVYRVVGAIKDIDHHGTDGKGMAARTGFAISGIVYGALGVVALGIPIVSVGGNGGSGGGGSKQQAAQSILSQPAGQWILGIIGVLVIGYGILQAYKAVKRSFFSKLKTHEMSRKTLGAVDKIGLIGLLAKAIVVALIGWFFVQAAVQHQSSEAGGLAKALATVASQSYGNILLGLLAIGLFLYGVFAFVMAKYRHFAR